MSDFGRNRRRYQLELAVYTDHTQPVGNYHPLM